MWYRFHIDAPADDVARLLSLYPGVKVEASRSSSVVSCHENAGWLVQKALFAAGAVDSDIEVTTFRHDSKGIESLEELVQHGFRDWCPAFATHYQRDGIIRSSTKIGYHFHWAGGSGKTFGAIAWSLVGGVRRTLVVTKAAVRRNFGREIERFTSHRAQVIEENYASTVIDPNCVFVVISWEALPDLIPVIQAWSPVNFVGDEIHRCSSNKRWTATPTVDGRLSFSMRNNISAAAYLVSRRCQRRLGLTATTITDRVRGMWSQLDIIDPDAWGPFYSDKVDNFGLVRPSFTRRYCAAGPGAFGGIDTMGHSNLDELDSRVSLVADNVPHSVTHRDLPPRRRLVTIVPESQQVRGIGFNKSFFKKAMQYGGGVGLLEARIMEAAARKRKIALEIIVEAIETNQKVVVFTGRISDCDDLFEEVKAAVSKMKKRALNEDDVEMDGGSWVTLFKGHGSCTSPQERDQISLDYFAAAGPAVLVGTLESWGEGVNNLQDTDLALNVMLPYTTGKISQGEWRFTRHGQKRPVLIQYLIAEGTVDEHIAGIVLNKLPAVEKVLHDDSIEGLGDQLLGGDSDESLVSSILRQMGIEVESIEDSDSGHKTDDSDIDSDVDSDIEKVKENDKPAMKKRKKS